MNCGYKNTLGIGANYKTHLCKKCGSLLSAQNRTLPPGTAPMSQSPQPVQIKHSRGIEKEHTQGKYDGEFKQNGIICMNCRTVNSFGKRKANRCNTCNKKLKVTPKNVIYFNGQVESVVCPKCKKYTDYKMPKCEHCKKKLKI